MRLFLALLLIECGLEAANEQRLALEQRAQSDFERVEQAAAPTLRDTSQCIQSQAALLPVAQTAQLSLVHYRKGYCTLASAALTRGASEFADAAAEFDKAVATWPVPDHGKVAPQPVSSALPVLSAVAHLKAATDDATLDRAQSTIVSAVAQPACNSDLMPTAICQADLAVGHQWLGWIALQRGNFIGAEREFSFAPASGWTDWVAGRQAFDRHQYPEAAAAYEKAVMRWQQDQRETAPPLLDRLRPAPEMGLALTDLGGAQLLVGQYPKAIQTLDRAAKDDPRARTFYLRARAKELAGQGEAALADYNLASRNAFAAAKDLASGEAHLYRGMLLYRRKDYTRAEDEFSSSMNFEIPRDLRTDAVAWRHLSAVMSGSCDASRDLLTRAMVTVSPYFPKEEAMAAVNACTSTVTAVQPVSPPK